MIIAVMIHKHDSEGKIDFSSFRNFEIDKK